MFVIGIDVHVRNSFIQIGRVDGTVLKKGRVPNTLMDLARFLAPVEGQAIKAVMESTTNSRPVYLMWQEFARQAGCELDLRVLHARKLHMIGKSQSKCDKIDASELMGLAGSNLRLSVSHMPDQEIFELRETMRTREDLVDTRTLLKCRAHAVLHRRGHLLPEETGLFTKAGRDWVGGLELGVAGSGAMKCLYGLIDALDEQIKGYDRKALEASRMGRFKADYELLVTMPGVGLITAMTVLGELADIGRFKSRASVANFSGLVPVNRSSNEKNWQGSIKSQGPRHLRRVLGEAAWSAIGSSVKYGEIYQKIVEVKGKKAVAATAIARRMIEDMYTMLKTRCAFEDKSSKGDAGCRSV